MVSLSDIYKITTVPADFRSTVYVLCESLSNTHDAEIAHSVSTFSISS